MSRKAAVRHAPSHRIEVDAAVERLSDVRAFVRECATELGATPRAVDDLVQAVDEATCNVMVHGYAGRPGEIEIEAGARDGAIEVRILDRAPAFDPTTVPEPDPARPPAPSRPGGMGMGIHLMRTMVDDVHHAARPDGGNELTLVRSIDDAGGHDAGGDDGAEED